MEGEEVICPDSVLKALSSHGWIIPSEQQVSKNIVTISKRELPLTDRCSASKWAVHIYCYLLSVITVDDDDEEEEDDDGDGDGDDFSDDSDNGLVIEIDMMDLAIILMTVVLVMRRDGEVIYLLVIEDNDAYAGVDIDWLWWLMMLVTTDEFVDNDGDSYLIKIWLLTVPIIFFWW